MLRPFPRALAALTTGAVALLAAVARAVPASPGASIGGDELASRHTVVPLLPGAAKLPSVHASSYVVADLDTGQILAARDAHGKYLPASTIKVLTAITLLPLVPPTTPITATYDDTSVDGSRVG